MKKLDSIDCQILEELQKDGKITIKELAQKLGLSSTPIFERVKKLENTGLNSIPATSSQRLGRITFEDFTFTTTSVVRDGFIHTVAQLGEGNSSVTSKCFYLNQDSYASQHQITRQNLVADFAQATQIRSNEINIRKDEWKMPHLYIQNKKQPTMITMAHHGHYGGYAILLRKSQQNRIL